MAELPTQSSRSAGAYRSPSIRSSSHPGRSTPAPSSSARAASPRSAVTIATARPAAAARATSCDDPVVALAAGVDHLDGAGHALRHTSVGRAPSSTRMTCGASPAVADEPGVQPRGGTGSVLPPAVGSGADHVRAVHHQHVGSGRVGGRSGRVSSICPVDHPHGGTTSDCDAALSTATDVTSSVIHRSRTGAYESGVTSTVCRRATATNHRDPAGCGAVDGGRGDEPRRRPTAFPRPDSGRSPVRSGWSPATTRPPSAGTPVIVASTWRPTGELPCSPRPAAG